MVFPVGAPKRRERVTDTPDVRALVLAGQLQERVRPHPVYCLVPGREGIG